MKSIILSLVLLALSFFADAGSISRPSSSSPARQSIGKTAPSPAPAAVRPPPPPAPPKPRYTAPAQAAPAPERPAGSGFWSSFAGGAAGAAVGNMLTTPHATTTTVAMPAPGTVAATPAGATYVSASPSPLSWVLPGFAAICGIVVLAFLALGLVGLAMKWLNAAPKKAADALALTSTDDPLFLPAQLFYEVQEAFAAADHDRLKAATTPDFYLCVKHTVRATGQPCHAALDNFKVLYVRDRSALVHFRGVDTEDHTPIDENWLFERAGDRWLLAGIKRNG